MTHSVDAILDATGLNCLGPVMMLHDKVRDLVPSGLFKTITAGPSIRRDIPKFCVFLGHEPVEQQEEAGTYLYWIRKETDQAFHGPRHPMRFSATSP